MVNLDDFYASKFNFSNNREQTYKVIAESCPFEASYIIVGVDFDIELLKTKIYEKQTNNICGIFSLETDFDTEPNIQEFYSLTMDALKGGYHIIFSSLSYLKLVDIFGIETLRNYFDHLHLAKINRASLQPDQNDLLEIKCLCQRPIIDWAYEKMLAAETSLACTVLELYLDLYGPRELSSIERMKYISSEDQTSLPNGDIALVLNSGANLEKSWIFYKDAVEGSVRRKIPKLPLPFWDGEGITNKKIVFRRVHSPTDEILYASIFKELIEDGFNFVIESDKRLVDLFARSFPGVEVIPRLEDEPHPRLLEDDIYFQANYSDSFELYRNNLNKFPNHSGYLIADPEKVAFWDNYFQQFGDKPRIGISWGSKSQGRFANRMITKLTQWAPILSVEDVSFINLQYGPVDEDLAWAADALDSEIHVIPNVDIYDDLESLAAIIKSLDLVIAAPNINAHMAGAVGTPLWEIIPNFWHLLFGQNYFPFYPKARTFDLPETELTDIAFLLTQNVIKAKEEIDFRKHFCLLADRIQ
jgi:hypothetical protein